MEIFIFINLKIVKSKKWQKVLYVSNVNAHSEINDNELLNNDIRCRNCIKEICCCTTIHKFKLKKTSLSSNLTLQSKTRLFFTTTKSMYSAALGIEILCIMAAEIGENIGLYTFGFNLIGITLAYIIGYANVN